jgi:hypothetical protein
VTEMCVVRSLEPAWKTHVHAQNPLISCRRMPKASLDRWNRPCRGHFAGSLTGADFSAGERSASPGEELAAGLLSWNPMNPPNATAALPEILAVLESISAALRSRDLDRTISLQERAIDLLQSRPLDACDRMILGTVLRRIRKNAGEGTIVKDLESCLLAA